MRLIRRKHAPSRYVRTSTSNTRPSCHMYPRAYPTHARLRSPSLRKHRRGQDTKKNKLFVTKNKISGEKQIHKKSTNQAKNEKKKRRQNSGKERKKEKNSPSRSKWPSSPFEPPAKRSPARPPNPASQARPARTGVWSSR